MTEKHPQQQFVTKLPALPRRGRHFDVKRTMEYELHVEMLEAERLSKKPRDNCVVGYPEIKNRFRR